MILGEVSAPAGNPVSLAVTDGRRWVHGRPMSSFRARARVQARLAVARLSGAVLPGEAAGAWSRFRAQRPVSRAQNDRRLLSALGTGMIGSRRRPGVPQL